MILKLNRRGALAGIAGALVASGCAVAGEGGDGKQAAAPLEPLEIVTSQGVRKFQVEIADTDDERAKGLMFRQEMANDRGMLFEFQDNRERSFWMKNTYLPLDIIYIGDDSRIVSIARHTTPFSEDPVPSYGAARAVLEINAGLSDSLGIQPGDVVKHSFFMNR